MARARGKSSRYLEIDIWKRATNTRVDGCLSLSLRSSVDS